MSTVPIDPPVVPPVDPPVVPPVVPPVEPPVVPPPPITSPIISTIIATSILVSTTISTVTDTTLPTIAPITVGGGESNNTLLIISLSAGIGGTIIMAIAIYLIIKCYKRKTKRKISKKRNIPLFMGGVLGNGTLNNHRAMEYNSTGNAINSNPLPSGNEMQRKNTNEYQSDGYNGDYYYSFPIYNNQDYTNSNYTDYNYTTFNLNNYKENSEVYNDVYMDTLNKLEENTENTTFKSNEKNIDTRKNYKGESSQMNNETKEHVSEKMYTSINDVNIQYAPIIYGYATYVQNTT